MTGPQPNDRGAPTRLLRAFDLNPDFGSGAFRRQIRLRHRDGRVVGALDDNNHSMWLRLTHDAGAVRRIEGGFHRWPTTACPGAVAVLQDLVGTAVHASRDSLVAEGRARRHCTHLYDLALLALAMAGRHEGDRLWDAVVPDARGGRTVATIALDGAPLLRWRLDGQTIQAEDGGPPQSLLSRFMPWATARYDGDGLEGATILRMAAFTARARAHIPDNRPWPLADFPERAGACHAYSSPQMETAAHRLDIVRDFSRAVDAPPLPPLDPATA